MVSAVIVTAFGSCQKDVLTDDPVNTKSLSLERPDVYAENGYLAFKDLDVLDSVLNKVNGFNQEEYENWENLYKFKSARTYYTKIFDESENLSSKKAWDAFKDKYKEVLKWEDDASAGYAFDYPFFHTNLVPVLNKDGLVKIGKSLFKYNKENKVVIFDGDYTKLDKALNQNFDTDNIMVFGKRNTMLKSSATEYLTNFVEDYPDDSVRDDEYIQWSSRRRMKNHLYCERFVYKGTNNYWYGGYRIYLYQRAKKKGTFGWKSYYTKYRVQNIIYKENGVTKVNDQGVHTTGEIKPSTTFTVYQVNTYGGWSQPSLSSISRANPIYFKCGSTCRGFDYYPIQIDYQD